jgi:hypothetical protein
MDIKITPTLQPTRRETEEAVPRFLLGINIVKVLAVKKELGERTEDVQQGHMTIAGHSPVTYFYMKTEDVDTEQIRHITLEVPGCSDAVIEEEDALRLGCYIGGTIGNRAKRQIRFESWVPFYARLVKTRQDLVRFPIPKTPGETHIYVPILMGIIGVLVAAGLRYLVEQNADLILLSLPALEGVVHASRVRWAGGAVVVGVLVGVWAFFHRRKTSRWMDQDFMRARLYPFLEKHGEDLT